MESDREPIPLGRAGAVEAEPLTNASGDHAILLRETDGAGAHLPRALLTAEPSTADRSARPRVVVTPLDDDVELRIDGDALAVWLAEGSMRGVGSRVPVWANGAGFLLVIAILGFTILGSITFFGWLFDLLGLL